MFVPSKNGTKQNNTPADPGQILKKEIDSTNK